MTGGQGCKGDVDPNVTHAKCPGQTDVEYRTAYSIWAISNSPLIVASDVRNMSDIMKTVLLNEEVIAVNQNTEFYSGNMIASETVDCDSNIKDGCQVWAKKLSPTEAAIVLLNIGNASAHAISAPFSAIPEMQWTATTTLELRDLWAHQVVGNYSGNYTAKIVPHGVQFLTATFVSGNVTVTSSLHTVTN